MASPIRQALERDLAPAMKAKDRPRVDVIRSALSAIANAEAVDVPAPGPQPAVGQPVEVERRRLSEEDIITIITAERDELDEVAEELESFGEINRAAELRGQAAILTAYLSSRPA